MCVYIYLLPTCYAISFPVVTFLCKMRSYSTSNIECPSPWFKNKKNTSSDKSTSLEFRAKEPVSLESSAFSFNSIFNTIQLSTIIYWMNYGLHSRRMKLLQQTKPNQTNNSIFNAQCSMLDTQCWIPIRIGRAIEYNSSGHL